MRRYLLFFLVLGFVMGLHAQGGSPIDITWHEPGVDENSSMPLGNGDIAVNAWTEPSGDLLLLIAKGDAWSETSQLLKIGQLRLHWSSSPFAGGASFAQTLSFSHGCMEIQSDRGTLRLFVDANHPVIHIEGTTAFAARLTVTNEMWRTHQRHLTQQQVNAEPFGYWETRAFPQGITLWPDTVLRAGKQAISWCHFNHSSIYPDVFQREHLGELLARYPDPLLHRCFGAIVTGTGMKVQRPTVLTSKKATKQHAIDICVTTRQVDTPAAWLTATQQTLNDYRTLPTAQTWREHQQWWTDFWQRSWITLSGDADAEAVGQSYAISRYMTACQGRGEYPMKFNGGLFCVGRPQPDGHVNSEQDHDPDYRPWGSCYWNQNTRHLYYPLIATGDYDLLMPWLNLYTRALPLAKDRCRAYWGHEGASFIETMHFWGLPNLMDFGWDNPGKDPQSGYMRWHTQGALEIIMTMLDYYDNTVDHAYLQQQLAPFADAILAYYRHHWQLGADGKLRFSPAQSIEMYQEGVVDPTPDIAGLWAVTQRLLALGNAIPASLRNRCTDLQQVLPAIPMGRTQQGKMPLAAKGDADGRTVILPAREYGKPSNGENPELYPVFPYRVYALGKPGLDVAINTFHARRYPFANCWGQDGMEAALLGLTDDARAAAVKAATTYSTQKFKWFWAKVADGLPDLDNSGTLMETLQLMLLQTSGDTIRLLPAWPSNWNASFKLHAPQNTTIQGTVVDGKLQQLDVTPASRRKDVIIGGEPLTQTYDTNPLFVNFPSPMYGDTGVGTYYSADPSARVWTIDGKERLYVYCSHDMEPARGCDRMDRYHVFSTDDLKTWADHGEIINSRQVNERFGDKQEGFMWAPDCVYNPQDHKYYFIFPHNIDFRGKDIWKIYVATSDDPATGFVLKDTIAGAVSAIDPMLFIDDDGQPYLYVGGGAHLYGGKLRKDDWTKLDGPMRELTGATDFHEGTWVFKHQGTYYLTYPDNHSPQLGGNRMRYATSTSPLGPWTYRGIYMYPHGEETAHGSVVKFRGQWYQFYHTGNYSGRGNLRSVCFDPLTINADGTIAVVRNWGEPWGKTAPVVTPGKTVTIEAEHFNRGGSHRGYFKRTANGTIETATEGKVAYVKSLRNKEWTRYSIRVAKAADYTVTVRARANANNSKFTLAVDGEWVRPNVSTGADTGQWGTVRLSKIRLTPGEHYLELRAAGDDIALDWIRISK